MKILITALVLSLLLPACANNDNVPKGILKQDKMQKVLWDVLQADAFAFQFVSKDSSKKPEAAMAALQQQIFATHKTTREEFYNSYDYYKKHPDIMAPLLDSIISKYTREKLDYTNGGKDSAAKVLKAE